MYLKNKKVILTGATGAIGIAIVKKCFELNWEVCAIVRPGSRRNFDSLSYGNVQIIECDLSELRSLCHRKECQKADYFIHLGWSGTFGAERDDMEMQKRNVEYAMDACEVSQQLGCEAFVFAGSQAEYGRVEGLLDGILPTNPEIEYGKAKLEAGLRTREFCKQKNMRHIYVRILSVYGPGDGVNTMVMSTIDKLLNGISPEFTKGEQMWDYLYSKDAAEAILLLCQFGKDDKIYCLGSGVARPLREYIETIGQLTNPNIPLKIGALPYRENQVMYLCADISDLTNDVGFVPKVSFEEGILKTMKFEL